MNTGIVTICYNGYGKYLIQWCDAILNLRSAPSKVVIVALGEDHGITDEVKSHINKLDEICAVSIVYVKEKCNMGTARNIAVEKCDTDYVLYFSADDILLSNALCEIRHCFMCKHADVVSLRYVEINGSNVIHQDTPIPTEEKIKNWQNEWINGGYIAFKRKLWKKKPYPENEYPNFPFIFQLFRAKAKFELTDEECAIYLRHEDSHCGRRDHKSFDEAIAIINEYV